MIFAKERGNGVCQEQAHGSADDRRLETGGGAASSGGCGPRSGRVQAHGLRLEGKAAVILAGTKRCGKDLPARFLEGKGPRFAEGNG